MTEQQKEVQYLYTKEQAAQMRSQIVDEYVKPLVKVCFTNHPQLRSATLLIAQYWDDEAHDAVQNRFIFSVLETPDLESAFVSEHTWDRINLPGFEQGLEDEEESEQQISILWAASERLSDLDKDVYWDCNVKSIPAFAAFCKEGCHQDMDIKEAFTPYAILRRQDEDVAVEIVAQMLRPWLDGIKPEWWRF